MNDAVWGFNRIRNTKRAQRALAMISLTGVYLPVCLPFGPKNGPEVFQRMMHRIFGKRLYKEWFIFLDDTAVATGFNHHLTEGEKAASGMSKRAGSGVYKTPDAHVFFVYSTGDASYLGEWHPQF